MTLSTRLSLITNYLEELKNIDFDYTGTINMKVNEYLSALLEIQLLYDDNALADLQTRQVFGLVVASFLRFVEVMADNSIEIACIVKQITQGTFRAIINCKIG